MKPKLQKKKMMKTYRELYFRGTREQLSEYVDKIGRDVLMQPNIIIYG
jgi:hypothetical protein